VRDRVNAAAGAPVAVVFPMDGFHYPRAALADFPDPDEARRRRGAPWTFDADAFVAAVAEARANRDAVARVPEFDHEVHDPEPGKIAIEPTHKIVLVEGNYLLLNDLPWRRLWDPDADGRAATSEEEGDGAREREDGNDDGVRETGALLDETWFVDASLDVAMRRVSARHVAVGRTEAEAKERVDGNDRINGALVIGESRANADVLVPAHERTPEE
jgi:pantothenate kinase